MDQLVEPLGFELDPRQFRLDLPTGLPKRQSQRHVDPRERRTKLVGNVRDLAAAEP